jgi:hypothetical protein
MIDLCAALPAEALGGVFELSMLKVEALFE